MADDLPPDFRKSVLSPKLTAVVVVVAVCFVAVVVLLNENMTNVRVPAGYAGYIYSKPIFGKSKFNTVLIGPASTGWHWRLYGSLLSITPYTYPEEFVGKASALAKDKLPLDARCHIVWRLKSSEQDVRTFLEKFGGWNDSNDPDKIAEQAYSEFIKEPFRTEVRAELAQYNGLDVNSALTAISSAIKNRIVERLKPTPFEVLDVVMGNANPPESVIQAISAKVASEQNLLQRSIQLEISVKNIEIETAEGRATGARAAAQAEEEAKAITSITKVLTPEYVRYLEAQNIRGAERVFVPFGSNFLLNASGKSQP